ncbi:MAG: hypothetical protein V5804_07755 [Mucilaginibacter sp.]|uniref:hypothetical protein n=1 Tax=Mucilaginibacter sp. TaxID=1882438 RepID=UPI0034E4A5B5
MMNIEFNSLKPVMYILYILLLICTSCDFKEPKPPQVTFDVPSLIGKNIDQVRKVLGKSDDTSPDPSRHSVDGYTNHYHKNGQHLLIDFDPHTRRIHRLSIHSDVPYDNLKDIMKVGNLDSIETMNYIIEPWKGFLGISFSSIDVIIR